MNKILSMAAIIALATVSINAAGTAVNTEIKNTATLSFSVSGVTQTDVVSNEDSFVVDKKIDFILTHDDNPKHLVVVANRQDAQRSFTLTNESNAPQKYRLDVSNLADGKIYDSKTDSADMQNLEISIDGGNTWTATTQTTAELAADATLTVLVRGDVLANATDGQVMNIQLEAVAIKSDGTVEQSTSGADNKSSVDTVLAEGTSGSSDFDNIGFDGKYSAWAGYLVNTPNVTLQKLSCVWKDEVTSPNSDAKRIPGATIVYVFDLHNSSASTDATGVTLKDTLSTDYDLSGTAASAKMATDVTNDCTCNNGDATGGNGGNALGSDAALVGQELTLSNLTVAKNTHTCVSVQVKLK